MVICFQSTIAGEQKAARDGHFAPEDQCCVPEITYNMIATPAQAGVQFKDDWIPACAGMTDG